MKVLVLGFYNRHNLGDDMFMETMPMLFPESMLTFANTDDFNISDASEINKLKDYDLLICGGGDLINDYFHRKIKLIANNFRGPVFGISIGIPYPSLISAGYLDYFDHVFIREKEDLPIIQFRLGGPYAHYLPDLGFKIPIDDNIITKREPRRIGVFLAQSVYAYKGLLNSLTKFIEELLTQGFNILLYRFNTSVNKCEDDGIINLHIYNKLKGSNFKGNIINKTIRYDIQEMLEQMRSLDAAVCMRFHSHIFATLTGTPFLSVSATRKVQLLVAEEGLSEYAVKIKMSENWKPDSVDLKELITVFNHTYTNRLEISSKLHKITETNKFIWDTSQINNLIGSPLCYRNKIIPSHLSNNADELYEKARKLLIKRLNYDIEDRTSKVYIPRDVAEELSQIICFDVTGIPGSIYVWGTTGNIQERPEILRDMIKWIHEDFSAKYIENSPKLCINYISQNGFKGLHRSGWQYVVDYLRAISGDRGVLVDTYVDRTFGWAKHAMSERGIIPYTSYWVGFIHHTFDTIYSRNNNISVWEDKSFQQSLYYCRGIFVLSDYLAKWWRQKFRENKIDVEVTVLTHPTQFDFKRWKVKQYRKSKNKMIINVGAWYRNPFSIYALETGHSDVSKAVLRGKCMDNYFPPTNFVLSRNTDVESYDIIDRSWNLEDAIIIDKSVTKNSLEYSSSESSSDSDSDYESIKASIKYKKKKRWFSFFGLGSGNISESLDSSIKTEKLNDDSDINCECETLDIICRDNTENMWVKYLIDYLNNNPRYIREIGFDKNDVLVDMSASYKDDLPRAKFKDKLIEIIKSVDVIGNLNDEEFDLLLSQNVIFLDLVSCSAVNTIIECIVRETPVIVNRMEPTVELLGLDYPLFYDDLEDIPKLLTYHRIKKAHYYLKSMPKEKYRIEYMMQEIVNSNIYKNLQK